MNIQFLLKFLSLSNLAQIVFYFLFLNVIITINSFLNGILSVLMLIVLLVDLFLTYNFFDKFNSMQNKNSSLKNTLVPYTLISFATRILLSLQMLGLVSFLEILIIMIGITSILFGINLHQVIPTEEFKHKDKLELIKFAQFTAFGVFLPGTAFYNIFLGLKLLLPLPAALVYFLISFDVDFAKFSS